MARQSTLVTLWRGLIDPEDMRLVPALALSWVTPDEKTWVVRLRDGVRFHDGAPLTAEDVAIALGRALFFPGDQSAKSLLMLERGQVDLIRSLPETLLETARSVRGVRLVTRPGLASYYLWFDSRGRPGRGNLFSDRRVRLAVSLAIDRPRLVKALGGSDLPAGQFVPRGVFGHVEGMPGFAYDPARARELLRQAGLDGTLEVSLTHNNGRPSTIGAEEVQRMLGEVGIRVRLQAMDWREMVTARQAARLPFFLSGWQLDNADVAGFLRDCLYTREREPDVEGCNPGFSNPALDRLIDEGEQIFDASERARHYDRVMRLLAAEMPLVPLYHRANAYAVAPGLRFNPRLDGRLLAVEMSW